MTAPTEQALAAAAPPPLSPARWRRRLGRALAVADACVIGVSSFLAYVVRDALGGLGLVVRFANEIPIALAVLPLWLAILYLFGCYRPQYQNQTGEAFRRFLGATTVAVLVLGFGSFALRLDLARLYVAILFVLVMLLGTAVRTGVRTYLHRQRERGNLVQSVIVVGSHDDALQVVRAVRLAPYAGYRIVGFADDERAAGSVVDGIPVLGGTSDVLRLATEHRVGLVLLSPSGLPPGTLRDLTLALEGSPIDVAVAPSIFSVVTRRVTVESIANVPILHVDQIRLESGRAFLKRTLDLVGALTLFVLTGPIAIAAAVAVRTADGAPVLFRQERIGRDGTPFTMLKFRTMVRDAEGHLDSIADLNESGHHFFKVRADPRVTRVGRFLRKWSIDEIPQLINVLRGEMSLVGPRPPVPSEVRTYSPLHMRRLRVRPGITGVWQVSGRATVPFDEAVRLDLFYIENWSLGYDLFILAKTVLAVLGRSGAW